MEPQKRVLVTGATGTLGSALVGALVKANFEVVANFRHDEPRALRLQFQTGCELARADVSDELSVETLFQNRIFDAVIHLAAINRDALLLRTSRRDWDDMVKINLESAFLITRAALQTLPRGGHLILTSSRVAERGFRGQSAYGAGKAALLGLMKTAAREAAPSEICVNAVCPGWAVSEMSKSLEKEVLRAREAQNWLPAADARQSFAALCLFLLKSRVSGQILRSDCRI